MEGALAGTLAPTSACWQDGANVGSPGEPYDYFGHGTHVMGTMTGVTAYDTVGVVPGSIEVELVK